MIRRVLKLIITAAAAGATLLTAGCDFGPYKPEYDEGYRNVQGDIWTTYDRPSQPK
jgi:hypothetical protein